MKKEITLTRALMMTCYHKMTDCTYFPYIGEGEDLGKSKGGELKMQKIQGKGDGKTLEIQREGVIKRQKSKEGPIK